MGNDLAGSAPGAEGGAEGSVLQWEALQKLAWCPVVMRTPCPDLPWAAAGRRLAPPRMARSVSSHRASGPLNL